MENPYSNLPDYAFWRRSVSAVPAEIFDPVTETPFQILASDKVAPTGSCFAQHISKTLMKEGFGYLVTERSPLTPGAADENYGVFPARFGNVYTVRQLLQLFERAYGMFDPQDTVWIRKDGKYVDPFRPQIQKDGFSSIEDLNEDREAHLGCVREMFETCDVFIFTLGLTEGWLSTDDGAVFPIAPGVVGLGSGNYAFENFAVPGMIEDLCAFIAKLRILNPGVRIVLTVSPVPLVATYEPRHVLVSTIYSKSALRVVADVVSKAFENVAYFPSYEIIVGPQARHRYYADDLREVMPEGVAHVMSIFKKHYLTATAQPALLDKMPVSTPTNVADIAKRDREYEIVCDEEILDA